MSDNNLNNLQRELEKNGTKKKKRQVKGTGFAKQRQVMEQSDYYLKKKKSK